MKGMKHSVPGNQYWVGSVKAMPHQDRADMNSADNIHTLVVPRKCVIIISNIGRSKNGVQSNDIYNVIRALSSPNRHIITIDNIRAESVSPSPKRSDGNHSQRRRLPFVATVLSALFIMLSVIVLRVCYFLLPKSGSILRNAVTMNVIRQHAMTMMKNIL